MTQPSNRRASGPPQCVHPTSGKHAIAEHPPTDREYQIRGVRAIVAGLHAGGRGQLRAACGTGKTKMALWAAERLVPPGGVVVITTPTVGLVNQILRDWSNDHGDHQAIAVCSDASITHDSFSHTADILEPVTTDPDVVAEWLRQPTRRSLRLIVGTHVSAHIIGEGLQKAALVADLLIVDEAHRSAGRTDKHTALVHDDELLPAHRRLYATATPKIFSARSGTVSAADAADLVESISMDDEATYGPVLVNYPISHAIDDGYLDDYRVAVVGVTHDEATSIRRRTGHAGEDPPAIAMSATVVQTALVRAAADYGVRRIVTFCSTIRAAKTFATTFPNTVEVLPAELRPHGPIHARHVHGEMDNTTRDRILKRLTNPPENGWTVISNARCLTEGIDIPAIDCVAFASPKGSPTDIIQAIGRALRRDPTGSGTATILIPILLPDDPDAEDQVDTGRYQVLWNVVRALRAQDDEFGAELDRIRAGRFGDHAAPSRIEFVVPDVYRDGAFLKRFTIRIVKSATSSWWDGYRKLCEFHAQYGHTNPVKTYVAPDNYPLGAWVNGTRIAYVDNRLAAERVAALDEIGFIASPYDHLWETGFAAARAFLEANGHLHISEDHRYGDDLKIARWMSKQRAKHRRGELTPARAQRLTEMYPDWTLRPRTARTISALRAFYNEHGHLKVPTGTMVGGKDLAETLSRYRREHADGRLSADRVAALEQIGVEWEPASADTWVLVLNELRSFWEKTGHIEVPRDLRTSTGTTVFKWLQQQRRAYHAHRLNPEQITALETLGIVWGDHWERGLAVARAFHARRGHLRVAWNEARKSDADDDPAYLYRWLRKQRKKRRDGDLDDGKIAQLDELGMLWDIDQEAVDDDAWFTALDTLQRFRQDDGHLDVPADATSPRGINLQGWLNRQRVADRVGQLPDRYVAALDELDSGWRDPKWARGITAARVFYRQHGHLNVASFRRDPTVKKTTNLYSWLRSRRQDRRDGKLTDRQIAELDALGMEWEPESPWDRTYKVAEAYYQEHGHLSMLWGQDVYQGVDLCEWLAGQRRSRSRGSLSRERFAALDQIGMDWDGGSISDRRWAKAIAEARAYVRDGGDLNTIPSRAHRTSSGFNLYDWVWRQRRLVRENKLSADRVQQLIDLDVNLVASESGSSGRRRGR